MNPLMLDLQPGVLTDHGRKFFHNAIEAWYTNERGIVLPSGDILPPILGGSGTFSNYGETHVLELIVGKTAFSTPTCYLNLLTAVPDSSKTGATVTSAAYTGYVPLALSGNWATAVSGGAGGASSIATNAVLTLAACTASSSTVTAWCIQDNSAAGSGNVLVWGSATSVVISTTQTPPTVASGALSVTLT